MPGSSPHSVTMETPAFSGRRREVGDRLGVIGGDQRRTCFDCRKDGVAHQRLRQQVDDRVDVARMTSASAGPAAPSGTTKRTRGEVGQAGEPGRRRPAAVSTQTTSSTPAGDEIGDRRPALQAEAPENGDFHAGSLRAGGSTLSDQQPSGRLTHLLHEAMTTKVSLRTIFPRIADPGNQLAGDAVEIGDIAGDGDVDDDVETPGDDTGRVHEGQLGDAPRDLASPAAPLGVDADDGRDQFGTLGQIEQSDDLQEVAVQQVAKPHAHGRHRDRHLLGEPIAAELRVLRQQLDQSPVGLIQMFSQAPRLSLLEKFSRFFFLLSNVIQGIVRNARWIRHAIAAAKAMKRIGWGRLALAGRSTAAPTPCGNRKATCRRACGTIC